MPRPRAAHAQPPGRRYTAAEATAIERQIGKMAYRLQVERFGADGGSKWVTLRGHDTVEPLLAKGPEVAGIVRVVKGKKAEVVVEWADGAQTFPVPTTITTAAQAARIFGVGSAVHGAMLAAERAQGARLFAMPVQEGSDTE